MASTKHLIKNGVTEVIYRFANDSNTPVTFNITFAELARADQQIVGTPTAGISAISFCTTGAIKITRGSGLLYYLVSDSFEFTNAYGTDYQNKDQPITIEIASGTLVLRVLKGPEYKQA